MSVIAKVFGTHSTRELKKIKPIVDRIESMSEEYRALTDEQLQAKTPEFKQRLKAGETLDDILLGKNTRFNGVLTLVKNTSSKDLPDKRNQVIFESRMGKRRLLQLRVAADHKNGQ